MSVYSGWKLKSTDGAIEMSFSSWEDTVDFLYYTNRYNPADQTWTLEEIKVLALSAKATMIIAAIEKGYIKPME